MDSNKEKETPATGTTNTGRKRHKQARAFVNARMRMGCMSECRHFCHHISPFDTARPPPRDPSVDRRELTLDSRVWVRKAGMKLRAEEDKNGAGRLQGQAESSYPLFSVASLVLATSVIAATKQKNKQQLKEGSVYSGSQPPFQHRVSPVL